MIAQGAGCSSCSGGQGTYTYSFATNPNVNGGDLNSWALKATTPAAISSNHPCPHLARI
jgi:activator of 2-hydroxyglutaryl-CoA dehydratase